MAIFRTYQARFTDAAGQKHGKQHFSKNAKTFRYAKGTYNVNLKCPTYEDDTIIPYIWEKRRYLYNIEFSNPIELTQPKKEELLEYLKKMPKDTVLVVPPLSPELYRIQLETEVMKKLNDLTKDGIMQYLTPRNIIIGLIAIGIAIYVGTGHKLF